MTTTAYTPIYALPHLGEGQPMFETRQVLEDLAERLELVLAQGGAASPEVADLLTLAGRVGTLENARAADEAARAPQPVPFAAGFAQYNSVGYNELLRCWRTSPTEVRLTGMVSVTAATAANAAILVATVPAGYRPVTVIPRLAFNQSGANAPLTYQVRVQPTGRLEVWAHAAIAAGTWLSFDMGFRTVNT